MKRMRSIVKWVFARITWPLIVSRCGFAGLIYMLFVPEAAQPALVVAFAAMMGLKPAADFDAWIKQGRKKD